MKTQAEIYAVVRESLDLAPKVLLAELVSGGAGLATLIRTMRRAGLPADRCAATRQFIINNAKSRLEAR